MPGDKATIFLAHSSQDFRQARLVRNQFEDFGHDVMLLKLSQQMEADFLQTLLRREIEARHWLVVLRSERAVDSSWVRFERDYAQAQHKPVFYVDLGSCEGLDEGRLQDCLKQQVAQVTRQFRVFISYRRRDSSALAARLHADLVARGYEVFIDTFGIEPGGSFLSSLEAAIDEVLANGALVFLMSSASLQSEFIRHELHYALAKGGTVIPCLVDDAPEELPDTLRAVTWIDFRKSYDDGLAALVAALEHRSGSTAGGVA